MKNINCEDYPPLSCYPGQIAECNNCSRNKKPSTNLFVRAILLPVKVLAMVFICIFMVFYDLFNGIVESNDIDADI